MTEISRPWNGIVTGDAGAYSAEDWQLTWQQTLGNGTGDNRGVLKDVLDDLEVVATSPASNQVEVSTGAALVQGIWYYNDTASAQSIAANASGSTRIDVIVLEAIYANQEVRIAVVQGTPGGGVPSLTQIPGAVWQQPLAYVTAINGFTTLDQDDITDWREYANLPETVAIPVTNVGGSVVESGDVVVWDTGSASSITTTTTNAATTVAGVVERRILATSGTGRIIVAGIYPVTVSAAVSIGALLVTSTTAGRAVTQTTAQRGYTKPFGRALTSASGAGERVLALINVPLQQTGGARVATGTYTGNGAATQAITGVGFQPRMLLIYPQLASAVFPFVKSDQDGLNAWGTNNAGGTDQIISLDADGFTVGDGTPSTNHCNVNLRVYTYWALGG